MCAVVGLQSEDFIDLDLFKKILIESMVRGKHATGISWVEDDKIKTLSQSVSADKFDMPNIKTKSIIGHCRYSTSNIKYNQPISNNNIAIAHNGVITQSDPKEWSKIYDCNFTTECDSEIILKMWEKDIHPLYLDGSMAVIILSSFNISFFRNEERPLYYAKDNKNFYIASTRNILDRCNIKNINKTEACMHYTVQSNSIESKIIRNYKRDLQ